MTEQRRKPATRQEPICYPNVVTLAGESYVLPHYPDKRGTLVSFLISLKHDGRNRGEVMHVTGTKVVFGLVLHRSVLPQDGKQRPALFPSWTISEPSTGCRVVSGGTRQHALDVLAELVAFYGGETAFWERLSAAVAAARKDRSSAGCA